MLRSRKKIRYRGVSGKEGSLGVYFGEFSVVLGFLSF